MGLELNIYKLYIFFNLIVLYITHVGLALSYDNIHYFHEEAPNLQSSPHE